MRLIAVFLCAALLASTPGASAAVLAVKSAAGLKTFAKVVAPVQASRLTLGRSFQPLVPNQKLLAVVQPVDRKAPLEQHGSFSTALFDNAAIRSQQSAVFAGSFDGSSLHLNKASDEGRSEKTWGDGVRRLRQVETKGKKLVWKKVALAVGAFLWSASPYALTLWLDWWGWVAAGLGALWIGVSLFDINRREKAARAEYSALKRGLSGGAPSSLEVLDLAEAVGPAIESVLSYGNGVAPEHEKAAAELKQFLAEVETGDRKNWSLASAATNLLGTAHPLLTAYRHRIWDDTGDWKMEHTEFFKREGELAKLVERLTSAAGSGDRVVEDLRFLKSRVPLGNEKRNVMAMIWKVGELQRESRRKIRNVAFAGAMNGVADALLAHFDKSFTLQPTEATAEALLKAIDEAIAVRRKS